MTRAHSEFNQNGYAILPDFLSKNEIDKILSDIKQIFLTAMSHAGFDNGHFNANNSFEEIYSIIMDTDPSLKGKVYDLIGKLNSVLQVFAKNKLNEFVSDIYDAPIVLNSVQVRLDDNSNSHTLPWHQETNQISILTVNVWLPLVNLEKNMGGLEVCPGSHNLGLKKHIEKSNECKFDRLPDAVVDKQEKIGIQLNAGDALVFHPFLYHRSIPNRSSKIRFTIAGRLNEIQSSAYFRAKEAPMLIPRNPNTAETHFEFIKKFMSKDS